MDTISSSVSTFTLPSLISTSREISYLKPPNSSTTTLHHHHHHHHHHHQISSTINKPSSILHKTHKNTHFPFLPTSKTPNLKHPSPTLHRKASTGYATALLDIARRNNIVEKLEKDVIRLSRLLNRDRVRSILTDPLMEEREKGEMVKEVVERGKFDKHLVALVKMVVEKSSNGVIGVVNEVLMEFQRIYDELCGTQVVLVPYGMKIEREELFGIAKSVQKISGAARVKVRHVVDGRLPLPSFAL